MEQIQSRRSSLESAAAEENGSKLNESFYSEFSQPIYGGGGDNSMDISQISGWSAVNAKWDISLPLDLNFDDNASDGGNLSLCESERQEALHTAEKASIHDLFVEECCELYNDIQNAIDELEFEEQIPCIEKLEERQHILTKKARLLAETASEFCDIVHLRMQTIDRAMEQLKLRHESESARSSSRENPHSPTYQLRQWIITLENKLEKFRADIYLTKNLADLQRLCADQQLLQLQIETEGPSLLNFARKHLQTRPLTNGKKAERAQQSFDQLEQRFRLAWLRSLENLGRLDLKQQQGTDTPAESLSEDEEPLLKRRRTTSSSSTTLPTTTPIPSSLASPPYSRTSTTDVLLIPSSTESECATEDDPDIIPFTPGDYESYSAATKEGEIMPELLLSSPSSPPGLEELCSASSRQLHDIGYSSGENSIHESLNLIGNCDFDDKERRMRLKLTPAKGFYKTVPLDDAGVTDTEGVTQFPSDGHDIELPGIEDQQQQQMLSESMIAQPDLHSSMALPDDYQEVMEMMDDDFEARIQQLQKGTQWKELKPKRISTPKRSSKTSSDTSSTKHRDTDFSCEASSEESDSGKDKSRQSLYDPLTPAGAAAAALPPIPPQQRKRRFKKAVRNHNYASTVGSQKSSTIMKNSLTNIGMDESVYIFPENPMSQSLSASFYGSKIPFSTSSSKRKHENQRIHRSASDYVNLSWNLENISNSFHSFANFEPLMTSTLKRQPGDHRIINRRPSVESFASTTSSGTVQETGDAHYEWDDYRDPPSLSEIMPTIVPVDDASTSSILDNTIIDEDFHNQIPFDDNIESTLHESQQSYYQVRRIMNDYNPLAEEHKDVRKALRISAKENVKKLTAIVKALPRNMNMDQINDIDILQKDWKATLDELGPAEEDEIDPNEQMEIDETIVNEIKVQLAEMKTALKQLLISDVEKMTIADLEGFIAERKQIWDNLVQRKTSLKQLAEQPGNRFNNHELVHLLDIVDQSLYTIGDSTLQLEASMTKYHSMGNLQDSLEALKGKLGAGGVIGSKTAEDIKTELELCQERMDALETVCNGLTTQLGDLAALNGNRKPGKQAKFWKELNQYKTSLKQLKEKFAKTSIKPPTPQQMRKRKTKEISTNTTKVSTTSSSTTTNTAPRGARPASLPRRIAQSIGDSKTLQFLLGATALLLLGLILISYFVDDTPQNNWRRMFGPQLDYVNGAPPS